MTIYQLQAQQIVVLAMQWNGLAESEWHEDQAAAIIAWVEVNGGEAKYWPRVTSDPYNENDEGTPAIAVRRINSFDYASPGEFIVMTDDWYHNSDGTPCDKGSECPGHDRVIRSFYKVKSLSEVHHIKPSWRVVK